MSLFVEFSLEGSRDSAGRVDARRLAFVDQNGNLYWGDDLNRRFPYGSLVQDDPVEARAWLAEQGFTDFVFYKAGAVYFVNPVEAAMFKLRWS